MGFFWLILTFVFVTLSDRSTMRIKGIQKLLTSMVKLCFQLKPQLKPVIKPMVNHLYVLGNIRLTWLPPSLGIINNKNIAELLWIISVTNFCQYSHESSWVFVLLSGNATSGDFISSKSSTESFWVPYTFDLGLMYILYCTSVYFTNLEPKSQNGISHQKANSTMIVMGKSSKSCHLSERVK